LLDGISGTIFLLLWHKPHIGVRNLHSFPLPSSFDALHEAQFLREALPAMLMAALGAETQMGLYLVSASGGVPFETAVVLARLEPDSASCQGKPHVDYFLPADSRLDLRFSSTRERRSSHKI
jgi:hypothetical protein